MSHDSSQGVKDMELLWLSKLLAMEVMLKSIVFEYMGVDTYSGPSCSGADGPWELCHAYKWNHGTWGWRKLSPKHVFRNMNNIMAPEDVERDLQNMFSEMFWSKVFGHQM